MEYGDLETEFGLETLDKIVLPKNRELTPRNPFVFSAKKLVIYRPEHPSKKSTQQELFHFIYEGVDILINFGMLVKQVIVCSRLL